MKQHGMDTHGEVAPKRPQAALAGLHSETGAQSSFTLIELLSVITIIILLAGIIVGTARYVAEKQLRAKAESQLHQISLCLELYKEDQGYYPISPYDWPKEYGISHLYDIGLESDLTYFYVLNTNTWATYNHWAFYRALLGYSPLCGSSPCLDGLQQLPSIGKNYYPEVLPDQFRTNRVDAGVTTTNYYWYLIDPFGKPWGYFNAPDSSSWKSDQYNARTYDLWSWGPSSFGPPYPSYVSLGHGGYTPYKYDATNSLICNWRQR